MPSFHFKKLLQQDGWISNVTVTTNSDGTIKSIEGGQDNAPRFSGIALPGFQNGHSHAFQYAMSGLAEVHDLESKKGDFWSWREAMYKLALKINPDQMEAIATMLYAEMVRMGYTNVAEFHYVHHDQKGQKYSNLAEMGERLVIAAGKAGINVTLVPIFYQKGGFGVPANEGQKRFISKDINEYLELLEASKNVVDKYEHASLAIGIHSMRAVEPEVIAQLAKEGPQELPFHIHIAEQLKEIEDCKEYLNCRPVEWLLKNVDVNERFHLVHATHLTEKETEGIAFSRANVVICPTTEGNLGDGIFPLRRFQELDGQWSIGTDSHIGINPFEELRLVDYGQRLISHKRDTFATKTGDSGAFAFDMVTQAGRKAMGNFNSSYFEVGSTLNACVIQENMPLIQHTSDKNLSSTLLYSADSSYFDRTIINGKIVTRKGKHLHRERILENFNKAIKEIKNR